MNGLFGLLGPYRPAAEPPGNPLQNVLPMIAGAAILGALSAIGMGQAKRPDPFIGIVAGALGSVVAASMTAQILRRPVAPKRRIGPKDWSPRTGECLCRRRHA